MIETAVRKKEKEIRGGGDGEWREIDRIEKKGKIKKIITQGFNNFRVFRIRNGNDFNVII